MLQIEKEIIQISEDVLCKKCQTNPIRIKVSSILHGSEKMWTCDCWSPKYPRAIWFYNLEDGIKRAGWQKIN